MRSALAIAWKEIQAYFTSPTAYIVAMIFVGIIGFFFANSINTPYPEATARGYVVPTTLVLVFLAPALTMRLMAEEQKMGTFELLLTAPVRDWEVVLGKFIASMAFFVGTLSLTFYFVILLFWYGSPDVGPLWSSYLGLILYGATVLSVGLLASSLTSNQIVAAVVAIGVLFILYFLDAAGSRLEGIPATLLNEIGLAVHFDDFSRGVIDLGNVIYYLSTTLLFLFLTTRSLESRRWR